MVYPIIAKSFEEVKSTCPDCNSLYIAEDLDHAFAYCMLVAEYKIIGRAYSCYKNCDYLRGKVCVLIGSSANDIPEGITCGLYYRSYSCCDKYRTAFAFPFTNSKMSDEELTRYLESVKKETNLKPKFSTRKELKNLWNDIVFHLSWPLEWLQELADAEKKMKDEEEDKKVEKMNKFIEDTFESIPCLIRQKSYYGGPSNEWRVTFKKNESSNPYGVLTFSLAIIGGEYGVRVNGTVMPSTKYIKKPFKENMEKLILATANYFAQVINTTEY